MHNRPTLIAGVISLALTPAAMAGEIQSIDLTNFGPFDASGPMRIIYDRDVSGGVAGAVTYGEIAWDELKAVDPGITVNNNVPIYGGTQIIADCVMAPRLPSLVGTPDRKCNDGFQTHKRYKMNATGVGPIDMVFSVRNQDAVDPIVDKDGNPVANDQDPAVNVYRMIGKLNNHTGGRLGGFRVELGHGIGGSFVKSTAGDNLSISLHEEGATAVDDLGADQMALFPGGLFYGPPDARHDWGFFSSTRAYFTVDTAALATDDDSFVTTTLSSNYSDLFGEWLPIGWVPTGWFYDDDGNPATDARVMAWNDGSQWLSYDIDAGTGDRTTEVVPQTDIDTWEATLPTVYDEDGTWNEGDSLTSGTLYATWNPDTGLYDLAAGGTTTNDAMTTTIDGSATLERRPGYQQGEIEDLANLNLNYYVQIGDITTWPDYDAGAQTASFTLRITPLQPASNEEPAWLPGDSDNDSNGGCVMGSGRSAFDPLLPGMALLGLGYLALRRRRA